MIAPRIVYCRQYNISAFGFERLHPFDSRKYGRAWKELRRKFGRQIDPFLIKPRQPISRAELLEVHDPKYLARLRSSEFVSRVLEIPQLRRLPGRVVDHVILRPMRWASRGTVLAAEAALDLGLAINLSGGYHHASPDQGHGFSAYADVGLAIHALRKSGRLAEADKVVYVDLDAHQGNGVCRTFAKDPRVFIYDQYNALNFPFDQQAQRRIDCDVPLAPMCSEADYLAALGTRLPRFLEAISRSNQVKLAIYNAGTDVYSGDRLGNLNVSAAGIARRDQFVLDELTARGLPTAVLLSGGYSRESYLFVAEMAAFVLNKWGGLQTEG